LAGGFLGMMKAQTEELNQALKAWLGKAAMV
jgi:hypothetical protein